MNIKQIKKNITVLTKRLDEVGKLRDKLRNDLSDLEAVVESVDNAHMSVQVAIQELESAVDEMSQFA